LVRPQRSAHEERGTSDLQRKGSQMKVAND